MLALDVVRLEAGLVLLEVDYTSARHALNPEQNYSPYELAMDRLVNLDKASDFVGRLALRREQERGGPPRRLVGVQLDWHDIEAAFSKQGLPPAISASVSRSAVPAYAANGSRQVGKVTSLGWSPILKQAIGLASVSPAYEAPGSRLTVEWTVEGHRGRVGATVVALPFLDLPRKRG
jgi:aminomethyltransferase